MREKLSNKGVSQREMFPDEDLSHGPERIGTYYRQDGDSDTNPPLWVMFSLIGRSSGTESIKRCHYRVRGKVQRD